MDEASEKANLAEEIGIVETPETYEEVFNTSRLLGENAIPIPPSIGERFRKEFDAASKIYAVFHADWKRAYAAFVKTGSIESYEEVGFAEENYVRRALQTLYERTFMQDPTIELVAYNPAHEEFANDLKYIIEALVKKTGANSLALRGFVKHQILQAHLTNFGIIRIGYTPTAGSREDVVKLYRKVQDELMQRRAETSDETAHMYALLGRLGEEMASRRSSGLFLRNVSPFVFMTDTNASKDDFSDTTMTFEVEFLDESFIQSEYLLFDEESGEWLFRYDSNTKYTAKFDKQRNYAQANAKEALVDELLADMTDEQRAAKIDKSVMCVRVFDKITRQEYLYIHGQWQTPLWVWQDELQLSRFFPYFMLATSPAASGLLRKSEASYYIPHQEVVNKENQQIELVRAASFTTIVYDATAIDGKEVDLLLKEVTKKSSRLRAIGVKMKSPEGDINKALAPFMLPVSQLGDFIDGNRSHRQLEQALRFSPAMQGREFRTNTTTVAVQQYAAQDQQQVQSVVDLTEEMLQQLLWSIAEIVVSRCSKEFIEQLVGTQRAVSFRSMTIEEFNTSFTLQLEAGSLEKPNSANRKQESMAIIQMLGQFGTAAPITIISIVSKLLRKVFSRSLVTDEDLDTLKQEGVAAMQKGVSTPETMKLPEGKIQ